MSSKILLLLLGTFLFVQSSIAIPLPTAEVPSENVVDTKLKPEVETNAFYSYISGQINKLADVISNIEKNVLNVGIDDIVAGLERNFTAQVEEHKKKLKELEEQKTDVDLDYIEKLTTALKDILELQKSIEPMAIKMYEELLAKIGLNDPDRLFAEKLKEVFSKDVIDKAFDILNSIPNEEWPEKNQVREVLKKFDMEKDIEKKLDILDELSKFYEE